MTLYSSLFHLQENPFGETPDTRFFFESNAHRSALESLHTLVKSRRGFAVLSGPVGVGKTLVSRLLLKQLGKDTHTALILFPHLNEAELIGVMCDELGIPAGDYSPTSVKAQMDRLHHFLFESARAGRRTVVIIDEAQHLPLATLETIRLLTNLETDQHKLLQIILVGQPELEAILADPRLSQLNQRVSIRERLIPFTANEAERYVRHRLEKAGGANFLRFDPAAVAWLNQRAGGIPRLLNRECERLVEAAGRARQHLITLEFVRWTLEGKTSIRSSLRRLLDRGGAPL